MQVTPQAWHGIVPPVGTDEHRQPVRYISPSLAWNRAPCWHSSSMETSDGRGRPSLAWNRAPCWHVVQMSRYCWRQPKLGMESCPLLAHDPARVMRLPGFQAWHGIVPPVGTTGVPPPSWHGIVPPVGTTFTDARPSSGRPKLGMESCPLLALGPRYLMVRSYNSLLAWNRAPCWHFANETGKPRCPTL